MPHWSFNWFGWPVFKHQLVLYIRRCLTKDYRISYHFLVFSKA
jgi:hypothetical protein